MAKKDEKPHPFAGQPSNVDHNHTPVDEDGFVPSENKKTIIETPAARIVRGELPPLSEMGTIGHLYRIAGLGEESTVSNKRSSLALRINFRALNPNSPDTAMTIKSMESLSLGYMFSAKLRDNNGNKYPNSIEARDVASESNSMNYGQMLSGVREWIEKNLPGDEFAAARTQILSNIAQFILIVKREGVLTDSERTLQMGKLPQLVNSIDALRGADRGRS